MSGKALRCISILGIFAAVFPFVVLYEGVSEEAYVLWHYPVLYTVLAVFFFWGMLCAAFGTSQRHSRSFRPVALFLSRAAVVLPVTVFLTIAVAFELSSGLLLYILPASFIMFRGGYKSYDRDYSDIFGRGWFALFFVAAVISSFILWFTQNEEIMSAGTFQLCAAFGLLIVIAAILTNQTNIDTCTHQRDSGKMVLPVGLRSYNTKLCAAVAAVTVCLFLFAKPVAAFVVRVIKTVLGWIFALIRGFEYNPSDEDLLMSPDNSGMMIGEENSNAFMDVLYFVFAIGIVLLIIKYRNQIAEFLRDTFSFLFKEREEADSAAYSDETSEIPDTARSFRSRRRLQQLQYKDFSRETDPVKKYRIGYRLMLLMLEDTPFAAVPTDNTDIHRVKGESGLHTEKVRSIISVYNKVRYADYVPTAEEIAFAVGFIEEIRR